MCIFTWYVIIICIRETEHSLERNLETEANSDAICYTLQTLETERNLIFGYIFHSIIGIHKIKIMGIRFRDFVR